MMSMPNRADLGDILRRYRDVCVGSTLLLIFALIIVGAQYVQMIVIATIDARFWPTLVGILGCILSGIYIVQSYVAGSQLARPEGKGRTPGPIASKAWHEKWDWQTLLTFVLLPLYLVGISFLGWIVSTALYLFFQFLVFTEKENRKLSRIAIVTLVFTASVYIFFRYVFLLMLPGGSLW
jgi:putative tricarboxylic transport membrane protein